MTERPVSRARRRALSLLPAAATTLALPAWAQGAGIPSAPVKLMLGFAPGTSLDIILRLLAKKLEETWTAGVVVENRPGAGGMIAVTAVGTAPPDGQTLLLGEFGAFAIAPNVYRKLPFDPTTLVPVANLVAGDMTFVVGSQSGVKTMDEWRRALPTGRPLMIGTFGPATPHHLSAAMLGEALGRPVAPVHYRAVQEVLAGVGSGDLDGAFVSSTLAVAWMQAAKVNVVAVSSPTRAALLPTVQTFREAGLERAEYDGWVGMFAPPRTSDAIADRAHAAMSEAIQAPDVRKKLEEIGFRVTVTPRKDFDAKVRADRIAVKRLTDALNLKLD